MSEKPKGTHKLWKTLRETTSIYQLGLNPKLVGMDNMKNLKKPIRTMSLLQTER